MATPTPTTERERERERAVSEVKMEIMDTLPHDIKLTTASSSSASAAASAAAAAAAAGSVCFPLSSFAPLRHRRLSRPRETDWRVCVGSYAPESPSSVQRCVLLDDIRKVPLLI
jgi:hypothetical protein